MSHLHLPNLKTRESLRGYLNGLALEIGVPLTEPQFAEELDRRDELADVRECFHVPIISELLDKDEIAGGVDSQEKCVYLNGCSLGLQPTDTQKLVDNELDKWRKRGIRGHYVGEHPWYPIEDEVVAESAKLVGAEFQEVAVMNSLTVNIHLGLASFYKPTRERFKILMESEPFPSDKYAVESQIRWHGLDPSTTIIYAHPREGEKIWHTEDIIKIISEEGDSIALVFFSGVHYATGHLFDIQSITIAAHSKGCYAGFDLAHAAGNVELHLHQWEVDFACWCTYKYINSGPGSIAGFFVHEKNWDRPRLTGWWSNDRRSRLSMPGELQLQTGAAGFQLSNPPVLQMMCLLGSLNVFKRTSMAQLTKKSRILTTYLELLLEDINETIARESTFMRVVTSSDPAERGCQLSLHFEHSAGYIEKFLHDRGIVTDTRGANGLRVAPVPLYNTFVDVQRFYVALARCISHMLKDKETLGHQCRH